MRDASDTPAESAPTVYLASGGSGGSGALLVETVLAQFPRLEPRVVTVSRVYTSAQVRDLLDRAAESGGILVHTLVAGGLRRELEEGARRRGLPCVDLVGPLLETVTRLTGARPEGRPGLYRERRHAYFARVDAIEFAVTHDDGLRPEDLTRADLVLIGVSRCGKTPLGMCLAVQGVKVANVPFVAGLPAPSELAGVERSRVVGLDIDYERLIEHRKRRAERLGEVGPTDYTRGAAVHAELEAARAFYRRAGYRVVDVSGKPIESLAEEIRSLLPRPGPGGR
jgi:regulator of PEP synthase PpsR (kinase-PPPase family)